MKSSLVQSTCEHNVQKTRRPQEAHLLLCIFWQAVDARGNAAKAGLKAGDQVIYTSSFFGDELWPADKLGFTKTAINAKPDSVYFVVNR